MSRNDRGIYLRLPPDLRERVDREAAEEAARRGRPLTVQQWIRELLQREMLHRELQNGGEDDARSY